MPFVFEKFDPNVDELELPVVVDVLLLEFQPMPLPLPLDPLVPEELDVVDEVLVPEVKEEERPTVLDSVSPWVSDSFRLIVTDGTSISSSPINSERYLAVGKSLMPKNCLMPHAPKMVSQDSG